jgi:hypothetical protein
VVINIWKKCDGKKYITFLSETVWRIVESQENSSSRKLVNSLDEQILLEHMIEEAKPPIPADCLYLHPLLYTPFRYQPLRNGSRFGRRHERSLWYGSQKLKTAMAELAFYRFNFLSASEASYGVVVTQLTAFSVQIKTEHAIKLIEEPFAKFTDTISSPINYSASQKLGMAMREDGVKAFNYMSARYSGSGINIGLFTPSAFANKQPERNSFQSWQCVADHRVVEFLRTSAIEIDASNFSIDMFLINGELPFPAM